MNLGNAMGSMAMPSSSGGRRPAAADGAADQFPAGLRVLVVDDDLTCLKILEKMLQKCAYEVTKCNRADTALKMLRGNKNGYDIVLSDVHMPDMDGFKLLEYIGLEMDLPVIMMSADDGKQVVLKGVTHGACDYLIKPVRIEALRNIWQHVVRKKKNEFNNQEQSGSVEEGDRVQKPSEDADYSSTVNEGSWKNSKRRKEEEDEVEDKDDTSSLKKPRVVWSVELHQQFVAAVNQLGADKAVPKKILELMNVPGLTRENVASHLQKYRLYLRRLSGQTQQQGGLNNSFLATQDVTFGQMPSFNALDLQALAVAGQIPGQSLATLQAAGFGRSSVKPGLPMPLVDQRNLFSFEAPKFEETLQHRLSSGSRQMNLLHGIPTTMEPKQLANFHQSGQPFGNLSVQNSAHVNQSSSLLMSMSQSQARGQIMNGSSGGQASGIPSSISPHLSNGISSGIMTRNGFVEAPSVIDFPLNSSTELQGNCFSLRNTPSMSSLKPKGMFHEELQSEMNVSRGLVTNYNTNGDLHQHKSQNWELNAVGMTVNGTQNANLGPNSASVLIHQSFSPGQMRGQNRNTSDVNKTIFSIGQHIGNVNVQSSTQLNTLLIDSSSSIKSELSCESAVIPGNFGQDDLLSQILKQQEGIGAVDNEFDIEGFSMDNIPV